MPENSTPGQQAYWSSNLDPENLGGEFSTEDFDYDTELVYYLTPDQQCALDAMGTLPGKLVMEIGAGIGTNSIYLARQGAHVLATDISHERLAALRTLAARIAPNATLQAVKCAAEALPFRDECVDVVYSKSVLIHTDLNAACRETRRTMKADGIGVFIEPMTRNPLVNAYRSTLAPRIWRQITRYFGVQQMATIRINFASVQTSYFYLFSFLAFAFQFGVRWPWLFRASLRGLHSLDRLLFTIAPPLRHLAWFALMLVRKR